jgi:hypothetical protein
VKAILSTLCVVITGCSLLNGPTSVLRNDQGHTRYCDHILGGNGDHEYAVCVREANQAGFRLARSE